MPGDQRKGVSMDGKNSRSGRCLTSKPSWNAIRKRSNWMRGRMASGFAIRRFWATVRPLPPPYGHWQWPVMRRRYETGRRCNLDLEYCQGCVSGWPPNCRLVSCRPTPGGSRTDPLSRLDRYCQTQRLAHPLHQSSCIWAEFIKLLLPCISEIDPNWRPMLRPTSDAYNILNFGKRAFPSALVRLKVL